MTMQIRVDPDICEGHGLCAIDAPGIFALGDDGIATAIDTPVSSEVEILVRAAAKGCPAAAIILSE
ncbi:ferredoxin [Arthrobacter sp. 18067]|uniref:ferredoxin n=1 Tax=Arthrobacter sp. 18067 TaxID=2681413 RepID=UPI00190F2195|nr:ferredoxin [Arthrobacter sp. 18067]